MKKYGFLLLTITCLTSTLTWVSAAETGAPATAPIAENTKPETMIQKAENAFEQTEEKIKDVAEKVMEKTEEVIEGKKPEPEKAEEEIKPEESAKAEEMTEEKAEMNSEEKVNEEAEEESEEEGKTSEEDTGSESSDEEEISITEETMDVPEAMTEDAFLRACILHWLCHLNQHAHCWGPNCFFSHTDASSPIRRENVMEELLPNYCIGVLTSPIPEPLAVHFDLRPGTGLWVEHVLPGSPAAEAGIHRGDILLQATIHSEEDGEKIKKVFWLNHPILLMDLVEQIGPEEFELTTICNGKEQKTSLKPIERKEMMGKAGILK